MITIAIPTFNRADYLGECLESVISGVVDRSRVEILVCDNASTDETANICSAVRQAAPYVRVHRNPANIGAHRNFRRAAEIARGRFVWLLGDDDRLAAGLVSHVVRELDAGADMVVSNVSVWNRDFTKCLNPRFVEIDADRHYSSADAVLSDCGPHLGYISAVIFRRDLFLNVPVVRYLAYDLQGTCFLHAAYMVARDCRQIAFLSAPAVLNRGEAPTSDLASVSNESHPLQNLDVRYRDEEGWVRVFGVGFPKTIRDLQQWGYTSDATRHAIDCGLRYYLIPRVLYWKRYGMPVSQLERIAKAYSAQRTAAWYTFVTLAHCPVFLLLIMRAGRRFVRAVRGLSRARRRLHPADQVARAEHTT